MNTTEQNTFRPRPSTILAAAVLTLTATVTTGVVSASAHGLGSPSATDFAAPDQVSELEFPTTISHRGGSDVYPEESMEGFTASAKDGFLPEMDIQFLEDGTPVLIHDDTADRTLNGASGAIRDLSREEWDAATIKHPQGGEPAQTVTLDEALDELGGKVVMVPEIKPGATSAEVDQVLDVFDKRGLKDSLIVQSFDFEAAKTIAERGYTSLYLLGATLPKESFDETAAARASSGSGREESADQGPARNSTRQVSTSLPTLLGMAKDGHRLPGWIDGYFTDDACSSTDHTPRGGPWRGHFEPASGPPGVCELGVR